VNLDPRIFHRFKKFLEPNTSVELSVVLDRDWHFNSDNLLVDGLRESAENLAIRVEVDSERCAPPNHEGWFSASSLCSWTLSSGFYWPGTIHKGQKVTLFVKNEGDAGCLFEAFLLTPKVKS